MRPAHRLVAVPAERAYVPNMSLMTADELLHVAIPDKRVELVRGTLVVREPPGYTHGRVTVNLAVRLAAHLEASGGLQRSPTGSPRGPSSCGSSIPTVA